MKHFALLFAFLFIGLTSCKLNKKAPIQKEIVLNKLWETDTLMKTCEAVRYNKVEDIIYVSNMGNVPADAKDGDGTMSIISNEGKMLNQNWVTNLNAPKGSNYYNGKFYVADIDAVIKIDIKSGKTEKIIKVENSIFLNDLDIDANGHVYITDSRDSKVYKLVDDEVSVWLDLEGLNPNGILVEKDRILILSFNKGNFIAIDKKTKKQTLKHMIFEYL